MPSDADAERVLALVEQAIAAAPEVAANHGRASELYRRLGRPEAALAAAQRAVTLQPDTALLHVELAMAHGALGDIAGMRHSAERAIALAPDLAVAHFTLATALLLTSAFAEGWPEYEWRLRLPGTAGGMPPDDWPRWDGSAMPDGRLLLFADQGRGDIIQFARYIPWATARCRDLATSCPGEMWPILRQFAPGMRLVEHWHQLPRCDAFAPLGSLPMLAGTRPDNIPPPLPVLRADPRMASAWRARVDALLPASYKRVGLIWAGNPVHTSDRERSTRLANFHPLGALEGVALLALQKGPAAAEVGQYFGRAPLLNLGPQIRGFDDTMAVLEALDLLVSVDTGVVHLAGAMGKPTWVVLPFLPDWRWLLGREDSPWYPSVRLFRQPAPRAWGPAVAQIAAALAGLG